MKNFLGIVGLVLIMASCAGLRQEDDRPVISVSIAPEEFIVRAISGNDFEVEVMIPPGSGHSTYDPSPAQIIALAKAEAYILNGNLGFEKAWFSRFKEVNPGMKTLFLSDNQDPIYSKMVAHGDHFHPEGIDPHFWMSPLAAQKMAASVAGLLIELRPENKNRYMANLDTISTLLHETDSLVREMLNPYKGRSFMIFHPALAYFARDYGLTQYSVEFEGKEPSAKNIRSLIDLARNENVGVILVQKEYDRKSTDAIANETGLEVIVIDPLMYDLPVSIMQVARAINSGFEKPGNSE